MNKVTDPELRRKLTPNYKVGCKRLVLSEHFYDAIQQPNAELVTESIDRIGREGVYTTDGRLHELDVIVLATGFHAHAPFGRAQIIGRDGMTLEGLWANGTFAYKQVMTPGLPNWFMLGGPGSPVGNFSYINTVENQMKLVLSLVKAIAEENVREISPKIDATISFNAAAAAALPRTVWASGCKSWYIDQNGVVKLWPWSFKRFEADMEQPVWEDFDIA